MFIEFVKKPCPVTYKLLTEVAAKLGIEHPAKEMSEVMCNAAQFDIPNYNLTDEEYQTILEAEEYGRGKPGVLLDYCGKFGHKKVLSIDYRPFLPIKTAELMSFWYIPVISKPAIKRRN